jgi:hypothetical protein
MEKTSEDFVKSLKDKILRTKKKEEFQRNILQDSLEYLILLFNTSGEIDIKSTKNFETSEISCFLNLYSESENITETISNILKNSNVPFRIKDIGKRKTIFLMDFGGNLISSGREHDWVYVEFYFKGKHIFEAKLTLLKSDLEYFIFDKQYFNIGIWLCDHLEMKSYDIQIMSSDRKKRSMRKQLDEKYNLVVGFDQTGEVEKIKILKIGSKKNN